MKKIKCLIGIHNKKIISKQKTVESDFDTNINLTRDVLRCDDCEKIFYNRTDGLIFINDNISRTWTWKFIKK